MLLNKEGCTNGRKRPYLKSLSTNTSVEVFPFELGRSSMKSIDTLDHIPFGIERGFKMLAKDEIDIL